MTEENSGKRKVTIMTYHVGPLDNYAYQLMQTIKGMQHSMNFRQGFLSKELAEDGARRAAKLLGWEVVK